MDHRVVRPHEFDWATRPHEPGEPARHVAELSELTEMKAARANIWRYEPGATGVRHRHPLQEETFIVLAGTLSIYIGDPPTREDVPTGSAVRVAPGTPIQSANHGVAELVVYVHGWPAGTEPAEILDPVV